MNDDLKNMIDDIISGNDEDAEIKFHSFAKSRIKSLIGESDEPSAGLSKKQKSNLVKRAKRGEDIGKKGKGFDEVADKAAKKYGSKEKGEKVAAAAMWKNAKR